MRHCKQTVLLYGVHSMNLGDDLFLKIILERYPDVKFVMYAPAIYMKMLCKYPNCIVISESKLITKIIYKLSQIFHFSASTFIYFCMFLRYKIDIFLIVGGSIFMEGKSNIPNIIYKFQKLKKIFKTIKVVVIGCNFGPYKTKRWKAEVETALKNVDDVCFRDKYSYDTFSSLSNVRCANDIVMHLNVERNVKKQKILCVNIRSVDKWPSLKPNKNNYLTNTKKNIEHFQEKGYLIKLISFCEKYGDEEIMNELYDILDDKSLVERYSYRGNMEDCLNIISSAEYLLATRFHAIILGLIYQVKVFPISYSIKTENMLKTLELWKDCYDYNEFCKGDFSLKQNLFIEDYHLDKKNNTQFEYLDNIM